MINTPPSMRIWGQRMGKRILIGSMLVLVLLLLMPSIPAIQQNAVEEGIKQDLQEKLESITIDDLKDIEVLDGIKHPILYFLVIFITNFRMKRAWFFIDISSYFIRRYLVVDNPLIYLRGEWLYITTWLWYYFWHNISDRFGWGW